MLFSIGKVQVVMLFTFEVGQVTVRPSLTGIGVVDGFTVIALLPPKFVVAVLAPAVVPTPTLTEKDPEDVKAVVTLLPPLSMVTVIFPPYGTPPGAPVA